ncbi:MAG: DNA polymerase III subunit gamma/tau [Helicobacteraceae bacterium 4484_230]|nr:MAG: DNA polymerase III subunit gamma/tau [Helicobacteraceae bacterium 4484_230]
MKENSEVLALKYRPHRFEDLIGQETVTQTLSLALDTNRLSHAYLLSGLRGSGKTSTARIFAKALICEKGPTSKPCEECEHCRMANEGRHMDIIEMDAASSRKIDDIRDLIEHTRYKPAAAAFKIFIIDEVHMLTKEAFNALLKTLEEPPEYIKFILATTDPLKLPATILSRTQHFRFKRISDQNIVNHLAHILNLEQIEYQKEALEILSRSGSGSLRDTLTLLDQAIIYSKNFVDVKTVTDMLGLIDPKFIEDIFDAIFTKDNDRLISFVKQLEDYEAEMVVNEFIAFLKERLYAQDARYSTLLLERFFRILSDAKSLFAINADGSFVLGLIFFKMIEALRVKEIDQMIESLESQTRRPDISAVQPSHTVAAQSSIEKAEDKKESESKSGEIIKDKDKQEDLKYVNLYKELCERINDRSADLGKCFKEQVQFISYLDSTLTWESCADENCKQQLRHGYSVIKQFVKEIFGFETRIKAEPCSKVKKDPETEKENAKEEERPAYMDDPADNIQSPDKEPQPSSMTEEIETGGGSCVQSCSDTDESAAEFDGSAILEEPMVKKAAELFEATKITVQHKV